MASDHPCWDPQQYERFKAERARPFHDLVARVAEGSVSCAADLGCGTGELTRRLVDLWPAATTWGVDRSPEMLAKASAHVVAGRLSFVAGDLSEWTAPQPLDRIVSNAALQWVPDHGSLLARLAGMLAPSGVLAVQVPNNGREPSNRFVREMVAESRWNDRLAGVSLPKVQTAEWYFERLTELALAADVWETIYYHHMPDAAAIVQWQKGTVLRPILSALDPDAAREFVVELTARVESHYRSGPAGVLFPFRRLFFTGRRPASP
mgnify:CR=1 FL=1